MTDYLNHKGELTRRTVETAEQIEDSLERGVITKDQRDYALWALWNATAGLIDRDVSEMLEEA